MHVDYLYIIHALRLNVSYVLDCTGVFDTEPGIVVTTENSTTDFLWKIRGNVNQILGYFNEESNVLFRISENVAHVLINSCIVDVQQESRRIQLTLPNADRKFVLGEGTFAIRVTFNDGKICISEARILLQSKST